MNTPTSAILRIPLQSKLVDDEAMQRLLERQREVRESYQPQQRYLLDEPVRKQA